MNNLFVFGNTHSMSKRKSKKMIEDVYENCVSANDCTGVFQVVTLDPEEIKKFHEMYNEID